MKNEMNDNFDIFDKYFMGFDIEDIIIVIESYIKVMRYLLH